ncbi:DMT family transporter [Roseobacter sp. HKCCA0434]|uniref:DMT family transporter n=1 Tax=Roseobacter sp. HKCCA0434 TaxID=3079297 RepID=UPI002905EF20|nr:DMT family transporter [Roseobacter sp. HKCCA0434]
MLPEIDLKRGILLMLGSILCFTLMDASAKALTADNPPLMIVWARYAGQVFWTVLLLAPRLPRLLRTRHPGLQLTRSALLFGATLCFVLALSRLPLASAVAVFQVAPLVTALLAVLFLRERVGPRRWAALLVGFAGALVIIRPGADLFDPFALLPMLAATSYAAYAIVTRALGQDEDPMTSFVYTGLFGAAVTSVALLWTWQMPASEDWWLFAALGAIGALGQLLLILALRYAPASTLAPFLYVGLAIATVWGVLFFDEWPDAATLTGAAMIVGAGLFVWYRGRSA